MQVKSLGDNGTGNLHLSQSPPWSPSRRHLSPPGKLPSSGQPINLNASTPPVPPSMRSTSPRPTLHALVRERSFYRGELASSRPPSIRSTSSFGRPSNSHRLMYGAHGRRHSSYSNFSTMSETSLPWTTRDIGFNAISGVLNDPAKRGQSTSKPSKADVPPVAQASITNVKGSDFENYLAHIRPVFERYQQNKLGDGECLSPTPSPYGSLHNIFENLDDESLPAHQRRSSRNPYSLPAHVFSSESLASDADDRLVLQRELPMLENVPSIFFEPDFCIENPRTFDAVCDGADVIGHSGPNPPLSTNSILQEKLSYYLDTVEVHLIREIENRSSSFFEALSNLQALHQQTLDCVAQIHLIRQKMKHIQATECLEGLQVIRLQVRRRNLERLEKAVQTIKDIRSAQPKIQILLGQGDYFAALDLIDETKATLNYNSDGLIDFNNIRALVNFSTQLNEMKKAVGAIMQHDLVSILLSDLSHSLKTMDIDTAKDNLLHQTDSWPVTDEHDLTKRLTSCAMGLARTGMLSATIQDYKERLLSEIKDIVRKHYPLSDLNKMDTDSHSLAKHLKTMPFNTFFQMLLAVFVSLLKVLHRAASYHQVLQCLLDTCASNPTLELKDTLAHLKQESADVVCAAADLVHARCAKLLGFRSEQNAQLNIVDFFRLSAVVRFFIQQCELYCGKTCTGLRGTILSQQKAFIDNFHMERIKQEAQLIENEQWVVSQVPSDFQRIVDRICDGSISCFANDEHPAQDSDQGTKFLVICGTSYYVVGCSLLIIKMLEEYLRCIVNLESMTTDIMQKIIEFLKVFNSRVCQVILGAGAMRSAGLKNISAKHLALASQSIGIMIGLIPSLKDCVGRHMPSKHGVLLSEFDRILKDYKDHQREIHAKLIAIMNERFTVHAKAMQAIPWDQEEDTARIANGYMETLVKETMTLHKVLSKYLPHQELQQIMGEIFQSFTTQLTREIQQLNITTSKGKSRLSKDTAYFMRRLSSLKGIDSPSSVVIDVVNDISVDRVDTSIPA